MAQTLDLVASDNDRLWTDTTETAHPSDGGVVGRWESEQGPGTYNFDETTNKPLWRNPGSVLLLPHVDFDGANDKLTSETAISTFISASAFDILVAFIADDTSSNNAGTYNNDALVSDASGFMGVHIQNGNVRAYNWDGNDDSVGVPITAGNAYVVRARHSGGSLFVSVNGGAESSVVSGNTTTLTAVLRLGLGLSSTFLDGKIGRVVVANTGDELGSLYTQMVQDWVTGGANPPMTDDGGSLLWEAVTAW